jgi:hypothetical protein
MLFYLTTELPLELITFRCRRRRGVVVVVVMVIVIGSRKRGEQLSRGLHSALITAVTARSGSQPAPWGGAILCRPLCPIK